MGRSDGGMPDTPPSGDHLTVSLTDVKLAQRQFVRVHVQRVTPTGGTTDVTSTATLTSSDQTIATTAAGVINAAAKAGMATVTASLDSAATAIVKVAVSSAACHPVINELRTAGAAGAGDEWVEIYNPCAEAVDVDGWTLDYRGAATTTGPDDSMLIALTGSLPPGVPRLYAGKDYPGAFDDQWTDPGGKIGGTNGSVGLRAGPKDTGMLIDAIAYGVGAAHPFRETASTAALSAGVAASRQPFDGNDTNDNSADFAISTTPTPRALNVP